MSTFRDNVRNELVTVARHPQDVYAILGVLQEHMRQKINSDSDDEDEPKFRAGEVEMWSLIANLRADVAREYGYEEGK